MGSFVCTCKKVILLEITCRASYVDLYVCIFLSCICIYVVSSWALIAF